MSWSQEIQGDTYSGSDTLYYVSDSIGDNAYDGLSPTDDGGGVGPWATITYALTQMSAGDGCVVEGNTYGESPASTASGTSGTGRIQLIGDLAAEVFVVAGPVVVTNVFTISHDWHLLANFLCAGVVSAGVGVVLSGENNELYRSTVFAEIAGIALSGAGNIVRRCTVQVLANATGRRGISISGGAQTIENVLVLGGSGDCIYMGTTAGALTINYCTLIANDANCLRVNIAGATVTVRNTILSYPDSRSIYAQAGTINFDYCCYTGSAVAGGGGSLVDGGNNITVDPQYVVPAPHYRLLSTSPCIGAGTDVGVTVDIEGNPRGPGYDMGCYQYTEAATGGIALGPYESGAWR